MNWTKEQKNAIEKKDSNILVAAAAGSGKTAVLVERIIQKIIIDKVDIDKILIVTFTNAAASEMRDKILDALYKQIDKNPDDLNLQKQIILLKKSNISTIHSFCLNVIKNNFFEIDLSSNFRIATEEETELLKQECLEEIFEQYYENDDKDFNKLLDIYTNYKDDIKLKELILKIYSFIQSMPFPMKWLEKNIYEFKKYLGNDFSETPWGKVLFEEFFEELETSIMLLEQAKKMVDNELELEKYSLLISTDLNLLKDIKYTKENTWNELVYKIKSLKFDRWISDKKITNTVKDDAKNLRDNAKKKIDDIRNKIFLFTSEEALDDIFQMYPVFLILQKIINEFDKEFKKRKKEKNIIDFNDIEHYALEILVNEKDGEYFPSNVAKRYIEKFEEIAIDEYQDSNQVQEYILSTISNGKNMFMVGDVKQSIYKFRQACPELFLDKYSKFGLEEKNEFGLKIPLFKNFRSRENIINIVNIIFEAIMTNKLGDNVNYTEKEFLNRGAEFEDLEEKSEICIIDLKEEVSQTDDDAEENFFLEKEEIEAKFVANKIEKLINEKNQVTDKHTKKLRNIEYKDIVILLRNTSNLSPIYEKELLDKNIPVYSESSSKYLDTIEIQSVINILKIIDNPTNDIALVSTLRGPMYSFSDNELLEIRINDRDKSFYQSLINFTTNNESNYLAKKIEKFLGDIKEFRKESKYKSISELIWKIYNQTGFYDYVLLMLNGKLRQANLKMLFERAKEFEKTSYSGLYNFIKFIENLKNNNKDLSAAKIIGENENVVRIMSIHKSKGLEFPYVFLSSTNKKINLRDLNDSVLLNQQMGLGPQCIDYERKIEYATAAKIAMQVKIKEESIAEEMRILYVALTRAKDKLIITSVVNNYENDLKKKMNDLNIFKNNEKISKALLKKYITYFDWIHLVFLNGNKLKNEINFKIYNKNQIKSEKIIIKENKMLEVNIDVDFSKIENLINWEYEFKKSTLIPIKTTVSKIKQEKIDLIENQSNNLDIIIPKFIEKNQVTNAQIGIIMHKLLQLLDFKKDYTKESLEEFIEKLIYEKKISFEEAKIIEKDKLLKFLKSDFIKQIKNAKMIYKETPFCLKLKADKYFETYEDDDILVQGIIDLFYIDCNDNIIVVDYKTDHEYDLKKLTERYRKQLELYGIALEKYFNKRIYKKYLYSLFLGKEIEI